MELGKVIKSLNTGLNPRKFFQLNTPDAEFYYVTIKEMVNGKIVYNENTDKLNAEALRLCNNRSNLEKGDVLFTGTGTIGKTVVLTETPTTWNIKEGVYTIKPIPEKLDSNYLAFALSSTAIRSRYMTNVAGGTVKSLKMADLEKTDIPLPSLPEQQKIAAHLDSIQSAIDNKKQQLQQLDELVKSKFVEMFGEIDNTSFDLVKLEEITEFIKDGTHQTPTYTEDKVNGYKFVSAKDITTGKIDWTNIKYIPEDLHNELYKRISPKRGDILLAKNGTIGKAAIVETDEVFDIYVSLAILRFREGYNPKYIWAALNNEDSMHQYTGSIVGIGVPNLHLGRINKVKIQNPPIELQNTFAEYVQKIDSAKSIIKTQLNDLNELLESKMDFYFGE
ncbi:MAG: restriction endonuclease subunit S [Treponemataceae bacterium]|nr:restriction endonuclease subunit S [Treponemataceae bacterium]